MALLEKNGFKEEYPEIGFKEEYPEIIDEFNRK